MDALGISGWKLIVQLISFGIFVILLWRLGGGPIARVLDQREQKIREGMEAADRMKAELATTAARNEEVLREARAQAQQILVDARSAGDDQIARAKEQAEKQAGEYLARAQATLQSETEAARQQLRQEIAELAVSAATKIVRKELDPAAQARLIEETLTEASSGDRPVA
ncbi:MAG: F0F1 ATP synthase subunit B [Thermomicrobiales bacterium]|nr:F0F1 ATP synthase subunit B [Thermomicrobiales bacterium]